MLSHTMEPRTTSHAVSNSVGAPPSMRVACFCSTRNTCFSGAARVSTAAPARRATSFSTAPNSGNAKRAAA